MVEESGERAAKEREEIKEDVEISEKKGDLYLVFGGEISAEHRAGKIGFGGDHFKGGLIYGEGFDKMVESSKSKVVPTTGRHGEGEIYHKNIQVIGGDISYSFGNDCQFGIGAGANKWDYIQESVVRIMKNKDIIKENTNSVPKSEFSGKAYAELTKNIANTLKLGGFVGYDTKAKLIGGITVQIPINRK